ncbi:hypothetical protein [Streptomyces sp. NPDC049881]|uniref:hypothetical protein n=1 Tax=Streptomyces sp. NPDC049881 TaxID=3155778 RepID=UPI003444B505
MPDLHFTRDNVQEKAGCWPWVAQKTFCDEVDSEDMAEKAAVYARAAAEGTDAADIAERATAIAAEAGELDGSSLIDAEGRVKETDRRLRPDELKDVPSLLVRAMNLAIDAENEAVRLILGDGGLDVGFTHHLSASVNEYNGWVEAVNRVMAALPPSADGLPPRDVPVTLPGYGTRTIHPAMGSDGMFHVSLDDWAVEIRARHLQDAADDAGKASEELDAVIETYQRQMTELAGELTKHDYDLSEGPLKSLWINPAMARWAAGRLNDLLESDHGTAAEEMLQALAGVEGILNGLFDDYGSASPGEASRRLTADERAYLDDFFWVFDESSLGALGGHHWTAGTDRLRELGDHLMRVAGDGVTVLLDPELGGVSLRREWDAIPPPALAGLTRRLPEGGYADDEGIAALSGFGNVMSHSTVPLGREFGRDLTESVVDTLAHGRGRTDAAGNPLDTDARKLLAVTSRDPERAAEMMADPDFTGTLLEDVYPFDTWTGGVEPNVQRFVERATTLPEGVAPGSPAGRAHADAAYAYLSYVDTAAGGDLHNVDAETIRGLVKTYGDLDPGRFGRFAHLPDEPWVPYL